MSLSTVFRGLKCFSIASIHLPQVDDLSLALQDVAQHSLLGAFSDSPKQNELLPPHVSVKFLFRSLQELLNDMELQ